MVIKPSIVLLQGPGEGWAEGALAPPLFGAIKK